MEDVLAVYTRPRDGDCPLVCLDETSKQLIAETRVRDEHDYDLVQRMLACAVKLPPASRPRTSSARSAATCLT
jgi:hypothetical protein